jgi:hypothetical protein
MLAVAWEQRLGKNQKNNQANRISAVKRGPETPGFSQQQENNQQREEGSEQGGGRGRRRFRGKRGGRKPQAQTAEEQPQAGPSNTTSTPQVQPATLDFGYMASSAQLPPHKSFYPTFGSAFTLARRLDIPITTETLKRLEFVEDPEKDSRPLKKRKVIDIDNEVDLDWSGSEDVDTFMKDAAGPSQRCVINIETSSSANASSTAQLTMATKLSLQSMSTDMTLVSSINV